MLLEAEIDALDITVLKGGAQAVGTWATEHGFFLPPDAPEVLEFYAERSPIFLAARFNAQRAVDQGVQVGEGTPIHVVIPTPRPWVPLRILALGRQPNEIVEADVFLLTDEEPSMLPQAIGPDDRGDQTGLILQASEPASDQLMADLRSDDRMGWLPEQNMWLTAIRVRERADLLTHDLSIDATGVGEPDPIAAGLVRPLQLVVRRGLADRRRCRWPPSRSALVVVADRAVARVRQVDPPERGTDEPRRVAGIVLVALAAATASGATATVALAGSDRATEVRIDIRYSAIPPAGVEVAPGETVRFVLVNRDPIAHEFIVGDARMQLVHERGTEAHHPPRPGEISIPAGRRARRRSRSRRSDRELHALRMPPAGPLRLRHGRRGSSSSSE